MDNIVSGLNRARERQGREAAVVANFPSQILPEPVGHSEVDPDDLWIELGAGAAGNLLAGGVESSRLAVGPVRRDGVQGVGYGKNARAQGDMVAYEPARIPAAIVVLLVAVHDFRRIMQKGNLAQHLISPSAMLAHHGLFLV